MATQAQWQRLGEIVAWALRNQPNPKVAAAAAHQIQAGEWRALTVFDVDADGNRDPSSCKIRVDIHDGDGSWVQLVRVPWNEVGLSPDEVIDELVEKRHPVRARHLPGWPQRCGGAGFPRGH